MSENESVQAVGELTKDDQKRLESVTKKIVLKGTTIEKMKRLAPFFREDLPEEPKEGDIISFFCEYAFSRFVSSKELEEKLASILGEVRGGV